MDRYKDWKTTNLKEAQRLIITPKTDDEEFPGPTIKLIQKVAETDNVLDFGCGIGRNTFILAAYCKKVAAYDFPNMIDFLLEDKRYKIVGYNITTYTDWDKVKTQKFSAILCCLVLQHIHPDDLDQYLKDFTDMTNNLYVATRDFVDFGGGKILPYLEKYWNVVEMIADDSEHGHYQIKLSRPAEEVDKEIENIVRKILKKED